MRKPRLIPTLSLLLIPLLLSATGCSSTQVLRPDRDRNQAIDRLSTGDRVDVYAYGRKPLSLTLTEIGSDSLYGIADGKSQAVAIEDIDSIEKSEFSAGKTLAAVVLIPVAVAASLFAAFVGAIMFGGGSYGC